MCKLWVLLIYVHSTKTSFHFLTLENGHFHPADEPSHTSVMSYSKFLFIFALVSLWLCGYIRPVRHLSCCGYQTEAVTLSRERTSLLKRWVICQSHLSHKTIRTKKWQHSSIWLDTADNWVTARTTCSPVVHPKRETWKHIIPIISFVRWFQNVTEEHPRKKGILLHVEYMRYWRER